LLLSGGGETKERAIYLDMEKSRNEGPDPREARPSRIIEDVDAGQ